MYRISLFVWGCIGLILLALCILFPSMLLQANILGVMIPQITVEEVRTEGERIVPGGHMSIVVTISGDTQMIRSVYADTRGVGGPRIDLREENVGVFRRANIPIGNTIETGTYEIPVRVILQNNTQKEELLSLSIVEGVPETLRGVAEEETTQEEVQEVSTPVVLLEEVQRELFPVVTVAGEETIQVFLPIGLHPNTILATGEQFGIHRFDNYFSTVPIQRVALNSTGQILTITTKGLQKGVYYVISTPLTPLKTLKGEGDITLPPTLSFEYRSYSTGQLQLQHVVQKTHNLLEVSFNRPIDMHSLIQEEAICELRTKEGQRRVGVAKEHVLLSPTLLQITVDRSIPVGDLELWCTGLRGVFGTPALVRVLKSPIQVSSLPADQYRMRFRSDFNGDRTIDEQDLQLLLEAMGM